jgi:hypothetical protein
MLLDGTILNADVNASAAIAGTKISPDFGSQTVATTGIFSSAAGSAAAPSIAFTGDLNTGIYSPAPDTIAFVEGGAEAVRIDSTGRLLVGTNNAAANTRLNSKLSVVSTGALESQMPGIIVNGYMGTTDFHAPFIDLGRSRGTTDGIFTKVLPNDALGYLIFRGANGLGWSDAALISAQADGDWTTSGDATDSPGRLGFFTTPDGAANTTERMRITSAGNVNIGLTNASGLGNPRLAVASDLSNPTVSLYTNTNSAYTQISLVNSNGTVGSIVTTAASTAYNTSSDYRLKENITLLDGAIDRLNDLQVHRFNFIADPDTVIDGFIAHEAAAVEIGRAHV